MALLPTSFHRRLRDALVESEPGLFRFYASDTHETERAERLRFELLRSTYRMSPETHAVPYRIARAAAERLGVEADITLYQTQEVSRNASLYFARDAAHVALSGPLLASLDESELAALFGHELAHHRLFTLEDGTFRVAAELLEATAANAGAAPAFVESALKCRRWTEVFADRGAVIAAGGIEPAIACLVKISTGLATVSVPDYLAQAKEVVAKLGRGGRVEAETHPENAVRAVALDLWADRGEHAEAEIAELVEGAPTLEGLDLVQQTEVAIWTRALLDRVLAPAFMRTEAALAHARAFFPDYAWAAPREVERPRSPGLDEYAAYVLLDFAVVDPELDDLALARALVVAAELGLRDAIHVLARKELKATDKTLTNLEHRAPKLFERAASAASEGA